MKLLKALIVEDSEDDMLMLLRQLKRGGYEIEYQRVQSAGDMQESLRSHDWQIVLSDYSMPQFDGLMALAILKQSAIDIPFIMISGTIGEETAVQAMLAGVDDYFVKDNLKRLVPAVERELKEAENRRARRQIERELEESKKRLQIALNASGMGVWDWNLENNEVYWSPECFEIMQVKEFSGTLDGFLTTLHPDDADVFLKAAQNAVRTKSNLKVEFRSLTPKGETIWLENYALVTYEENGNPAKLTGTVQDITKRKEAERALRESEEHLRLATGIAKMFSWIIDCTSQKIKWSENAAQIIGCEPGELPENRSDAFFFVDPSDRKRLYEKGQRIYNEGKESYMLEFRGTGNRYWESNAIIIYGADGLPHKIFGVTQDITQSKQAEEALRESEERLRRALEGAHAGVWHYDFKDPSARYWSKEYRQIYGFSDDDETIGDSWQTRVHPDDYPRLEKTYKMLSTGDINEWVDEYRIVHPSKGVRWIQDRIRINRDDNGNVMSFSGINLDLTDRKNAEEALRQSEENLLALIQASTQYVWTANEDGSNSEIFRWFSKLSGRRIETIDELIEIIHPNDREPSQAAWREAIEKHTFFNQIIRFLNSDGEYCYMSTRSVPVFNSDGSFRQWFGTCNDISERMRAEEELRKSEQRFRSLVNATAQIVWTADAGGRIVSALTKEGEAFDDSTMSLTDQWIERLHPDEKDKVVSDFLEAIEKKVEYHAEFQFKHSDGTFHHYVARGVPVYETDGTIREWVGTLSDVTGSKMSEENLRRSEEQLRQAQKLESVGRLAGGIAHDFNNMLTAINGYSDLALRRLSDDDPLRRNLVEIKKAGERSAALTQQLLAFSRRTILQMQVLDINQIVNDSIIMLQRLIGEDIQINSSLEPDIDSIKADAGQLSQMLLNLVVNARDAMPNGGTITIETDNAFLDESFAAQNPGSKSGNYVMLAVSDTGVGIDEETRQLIFEPFFTTKEIGKGTGLGLSTVYGIVNQVGGYIVVKSTVGVGTTFEIYLPSVDEGKSEKGRHHSGGEINRGAETVLLVEDEELVRNLTKQVLVTCGYEVLEAADGFQAIDICQQGDRHIDLLLSDVVMPKMSGRELAEKIKEFYPHIKILFTSGYTEDAVVRHGISESEMNFIQKPFSFDDLSKKVRTVLDHKKSSG